MTRHYLKVLRNKHGYSQQYVAEQINVTRQYYQQIEQGDRQKKMDISIAAKLADAFDVSPEYIHNEEIKLSLQ